jgi:hypothetical protein
MLTQAPRPTATTSLDEFVLFWGEGNETINAAITGPGFMTVSRVIAALNDFNNDAISIVDEYRSCETERIRERCPDM